MRLAGKSCFAADGWEHCARHYARGDSNQVWTLEPPARATLLVSYRSQHIKGPDLGCAAYYNRILSYIWEVLKQGFIRLGSGRDHDGTGCPGGHGIPYLHVFHLVPLPMFWRLAPRFLAFGLEHE
jgi:hypothetical protein